MGPPQASSYKPKPTGAATLKKQVTPVDQQDAGFWLRWQRPFPRTYPFENYRSTGKDVSLFHDKDLEHVCHESSDRDLAMYLEKLKRPVRPERDFVTNDIAFYRGRHVDVYGESHQRAEPVSGIKIEPKNRPYRPYTTNNMSFEHYRVTKGMALPIRTLTGQKIKWRKSPLVA